MKSEQFHKLTEAEKSLLLPIPVVDRCADWLGLEQCCFDPNDRDCDTCEHATGRVWASISRGEETETNYYICDRCVPQKYLEEARGLSFYRSAGECFVCSDITGKLQPAPVFWTPNEWRGDHTPQALHKCNICHDLGTVFMHPLQGANYRRALNDYEVAANRAQFVTGRARKRWMSQAYRDFKRAERLAKEEPRETRPRSLRKCEDCAQKFRAAWLKPHRRYSARCGECVLVSVLENRDEKSIDAILGLFTRTELHDLRASFGLRLERY